MMKSRENLTDRLLTALLIASAGLALFTLAIQPFLPQGDVVKAAELLCPSRRWLAAPEPGESLRYILLCTIAVPLAWASWKWAGKLHFSVPDAAGLLLIPLWYLTGWWSEVAALLISGAVLLILFRVKRFRKTLSAAGGRWPVPAAMILLLILTLAHRVPLMSDTEKVFSDHLNIILYAVNAAMHGLAEVHLYGFYPAFLAPVFRLTGGSFLAVELVMNILYFIAFALLADAARRFIRNDLLLFAFLVTAVLICGNATYLAKNDSFLYDPYFAYWPVRFLGPALALNLVSRRNIRHFAVWSGILSAGSLWFNPDTGIAVTGALFAVILFSERRSETWKFIGTFALALPLWMVLLRIMSGFWPDYAGYLNYMRKFWICGYMLLPIQAPPVWILPGLVITGALIWSFRRLPVRSEGRPVLFLAVLGAGLLNYYIGRSHPLNIVGAAWPEMLILFLFAGRVRNTRKITFSVMLLLGYGSLALFVIRTPLIVSSLNRLGREFFTSCVSHYRAGSILRLLEGYNGRTVNILPWLQQGYFYAETGLKPGITGFGMSELIFEKDYARIMEELKSSPYPLVITQTMKFIPALQPYYRLAGEDPKTGVRLYMPVNRRAEPVPRPPALP